MSDRKTGAIGAIALVPALVLGTIFSILLLGGSDEASACNPQSGSASSISIDPDTVPDTTISGYGHEQLVNAAYIVHALEEYKNNDRSHKTMHAQASTLTQQQMEDIAAYFQSLAKPFKPNSGSQS